MISHQHQHHHHHQHHHYDHQVQHLPGLSAGNLPCSTMVGVRGIQYSNIPSFLDIVSLWQYLASVKRRVKQGIKTTNSWASELASWLDSQFVKAATAGTAKHSRVSLQLSFSKHNVIVTASSCYPHVEYCSLVDNMALLQKYGMAYEN